MQSDLTTTIDDLRRGFSVPNHFGAVPSEAR